MRKQVLVFCEDCPDRDTCDTPEYRCEVVRWVEATTTAQGVPRKVTDPEVLAKVAVLLRGAIKRR